MDKLSSLGATSVQEIKLCDVDFEPPWVEWVQEALPRIACVDDSGTLQLELVEEMKAYGTSDDDDVIEGDFAPGIIDATEIEVELNCSVTALPKESEDGMLSLRLFQHLHLSKTCSSHSSEMLTEVLLSDVALSVEQQQQVFVRTDVSFFGRCSSW